MKNKLLMIVSKSLVLFCNMDTITLKTDLYINGDNTWDFMGNDTKVWEWLMYDTENWNARFSDQPRANCYKLDEVDEGTGYNKDIEIMDNIRKMAKLYSWSTSCVKELFTCLFKIKQHEIYALRGDNNGGDVDISDLVLEGLLTKGLLECSRTYIGSCNLTAAGNKLLRYMMENAEAIKNWPVSRDMSYQEQV